MVLADQFLERLTFDAEAMNRRLRQRITPWELFALLIAFFLTGAYIWVHVTLRFEPFDLVNYLNAGRGDFGYYYYAFWLVPLFTLLAKLPVMVVYGLWGVLNVLSILFAARVFGGRSALALIAFQTLYVVFILIWFFRR